MTTSPGRVKGGPQLRVSWWRASAVILACVGARGSPAVRELESQPSNTSTIADCNIHDQILYMYMQRKARQGKA